jgi:hypothetical protein
MNNLRGKRSSLRRRTMMPSGGCVLPPTVRMHVAKGEVDLPVREMVADMLLELNRPQEALAEYERSMRIDPNRFNSFIAQGARRNWHTSPKRREAITPLCSRIAKGRPATVPNWPAPAPC